MSAMDTIKLSKRNDSRFFDMKIQCTFLYISFFHKHFHRFEVSPLLLEFINSNKVILFIINSDRFLLHRFLKRADHLRLDPVSIIQYFRKLLRHDSLLIL